MTKLKFSEDTGTGLQSVRTAGLPTIMFKRGLRNQSINFFHMRHKGETDVAGPACANRHVTAREDLNELPVFLNPSVKDCRTARSR